MLALYDYLRRLQRTVDDFDRLLTGELEPAADSDQGAAQLLEQTRFLTATFRGYEVRLLDTGLLDEHAARELLIATPAAVPLRHVVIAVGDRPLDPDGLWPADVVMLTSIAGLDAIDVVATDATLEAGYLDRLRLALVGIEETESSLPAASAPAIVVPAGTLRLAPGARSGQAAGELPFALEYRDREEELEGVARRLKADRRSGRHVDLEQTALVVARPLPYLYLARDVFQGAGVPFEALDTLPLAAEPYAAAVDVAMECVAAGFTRRALVALLRSPHFRFVAGDACAADVGRDAIAALDVTLAEQRYLGGLDRLASLADSCRGTAQPAFAAALAAGTLLSPLGESHPMVEHVDRLRAFLDRHDRPQPGNDRRDRVRAAVTLALAGLGEAYRRHDPGASGTITDLSAAVRRWLGAQTFALRTGEGGLQILDRQAARFADFDDVQVMGLVEGEWPERPRRNIFYPQSLLAQLEPARPDRVALHQERDLVRFARASFHDLLMSARHRVRVSTFALESDAVVEPSAFLDDLPTLGLSREVSTLDPTVQVFAYEALAALKEGNPKGLPSLECGGNPSGLPARWARVRAGGAVRERARFEGEAGPWVLPRVSVSRLERYLKCPFQFYVTNVLQVDEDPEDENTRSPLVRGRFLHELFETFFHEWQARGRGRITAADMAEARALFVEICEPALASLSPAEAGLERARLYGSAVGSGIAERVFAMEAERGTAIRERLMEFELDGEFAFTGEDGASRTVRLRAKIDRVDVLADGTFRVIDYKTKYVPDRRIALQLPIYSAGVRVRLSAERG
ncbi:MAG: PD-(D/E)XK nuclease family protein, partial [Acidobacteriota bacterium]|nr:PD-(D/E)XK nuclease family protein [Acidobacteriota bacterium]